MNRNLMKFSVAAALIGAAALPGESSAQAQAGWGNLALGASWLNPAQHAEGPQESLGFDEVFGINGSLDFWFGQSRRWGLGFEGAWTNWNEWDTPFGGDFGHAVQMATYDGSLQFRLGTPTASTRILPALSLGVGAVFVNPDDDPASPFPAAFCQGGIGTTPEGHQTCDFTVADARLNTAEDTELALVPGASLDFFLAPSVALRLEAKDYWTKDSPYFRISDGTRHDGGHNLQFNGGLAFYFGGRRVAEPGFVATEPIIVTPPPAPAPPPPPPPAPPAERTMTMCVVDANGYSLRTVDVIEVPSQNRRYVTRNGQRVEFATAYPATGPIYVRNASWYMSDQPLVVNLETGTTTVAPAERNRLELVLFGSPGTRTATDLVFIGTVDGTPIYANRSDIAAFQPRLSTQMAISTDLGTIMRADANLAREIGAVDTYYVAVEPNCVFQPVSVTHFVRRTRG